MIETDIKTSMRHIPKLIIHELYSVDANPRFATLLVFLEYNYSQYNNDDDAKFIWDNAHKEHLTLSDGTELSLKSKR